MNKYLIAIVMSIITFGAAAQNDLEQQVKTLKFQLEEQVKRNDYLKEALSLQTDKQEIATDDISIKLTRVYVKDDKIYIEGLIKNIGATDQLLQTYALILVDPKGNQYKSYRLGLLNAPDEDFYVGQAVKDISYGFILTFENIVEKIPNISLLSIKLFGRGAEGIPFNFKNVEVQW